MILIQVHTANRGVDKGAEIQVKETTEKGALQQTRDGEKQTHRMNNNPRKKKKKPEKRVEKGGSNRPDRESRE